MDTLVVFAAAVATTGYVLAFGCWMDARYYRQRWQTWRKLHAETAAELDDLARWHREYCRSVMGTERFDAMIRQAQAERARRGH